MPVRLPIEVRAFVQTQAERNMATMNSTIVMIIRAAMVAEQRSAPDDAGQGA
ncbi:Arc family DNA-binding protein [Bradyrhizobium sp. 1200_D9_N1_1]|uniref:Arc family DNA-binding protein n=1 Tax=Bradyrhizobium sp. 1200_D9_N1_1 TaxID=3239013 RepID=UPI003F8A909C